MLPAHCPRDRRILFGGETLGAGAGTDFLREEVCLATAHQQADHEAVSNRVQQGDGTRKFATNVAESSLVRESDVAIMTRAGREIGVASTKAFTTQLVVLRLLSLAMARRFGLCVRRGFGRA